MDETLRTWFEAQPWREVTHVPVSDCPRAHGVAAVYLAMLAFPDDTRPDGKRDRLLAAVGAYFNAGQPSGMRRRDILAALNRGSRLVHVRLRAAGIAARVMLERASSDGMQCEAARSINEAIMREDEPIKIRMPVTILPEAVTATAPRADGGRPARPDAGTIGETNVYRDVWIPSKPVLHMAIALRSHVLATKPAFVFKDLLIRPDWSAKAIAGLPGLAAGICQAGIATPAELIMLRTDASRATAAQN